MEENKPILESWYESVKERFGNNASAEDGIIDNISDTISSNSDIYKITRAIVKAIIIAKQNGSLPNELEKSTQNPQDLALLAAQGAVIMDSSVKLATGKIQTYEQLASRYIDFTHAVAITLIDYTTGPVMDALETFIVSAVEAVGQFFNQSGLGQFVDQIYRAYYPLVANAFKSICVVALEKVRNWRHQFKSFVFNKIEAIKKSAKKRNKKMKVSDDEVEVEEAKQITNNVVLCQ